MKTRIVWTGALLSSSAFLVVWLGAAACSSAPKNSVVVPVATALPSAPAWAPGPEVETFHGQAVADPDRGLEKSSDPRVESWTQAQASRARSYLDALPGRAEIRAQLLAWAEFRAPSYRRLQKRGDLWFALKVDPPKRQPLIVAFKDFDRSSAGAGAGAGAVAGERVVFDPNARDATGATAIDFFEPSLDGKLVAVSLSKAGSENGELHVFRVGDGAELPDKIPHAHKPTAGGSVSWQGDGFFYARYPHPGEKPKADLDFYQQIWFHRLGSKASRDVYALGRDFPRIAEIRLDSSDDGRYQLASVANGDGGEYEHFALIPGAKSWLRLTRFSDQGKGAVVDGRGDVYLTSIKGASRGQILRFALGGLRPGAQAPAPALVVPEGEGVVNEVLPADDLLYVSYLAGGPSEIRVFDRAGHHDGHHDGHRDGQPRGVLPSEPVSSAFGLARAGGDRLLFQVQSYLSPSSWRVYDPVANAAPVVLAARAPADFSDIEVRREFATSKDGARIPISILLKKGQKVDGPRPTLLTGYGGYGISIRPQYRADLHLWLERGGVYAVASVRGGGEFGENWHLAGNLAKKQNVFDDFVACAEKLTRDGYASPATLAIEGGSNGGLLMGAVLTQRPELFRAVVAHVGLFDMIRSETDPNGAFNVTEFGTVKDPALFRALYAYSPYHRVRDGVRYPPTLLMTGANDGRVDPYHSKKMAARLQRASPDSLTLLRVDFQGGHGMGSSLEQKVNERADVYAFLLAQMAAR